MNYFNKQLHKTWNARGFNIISLIVVMAVLAILVTIAVPKYLNHTQTAHHTKILHDGKLLQDACLRYYADNTDWPRLTDDPLTDLPDKFISLNGQETDTDPNANYYDIDMDALSSYVRINTDSSYYVLQNPVGDIYIRTFAVEPGTPKLPRDPESGEIIIDSAEKLAKIGNDEDYPIDGNYIQMADIDLTDYSSGEGWEPIVKTEKVACEWCIDNPGACFLCNGTGDGGHCGLCGGTGLCFDCNGVGFINTTTGGFSGTFDGNGFTISNLIINRPDNNNLGLFNYTESGAKLTNITLMNIDITGCGNVGGLVGENKGAIEFCCTTGLITSFNCDGGIVGYNNGSVISSHSSCTVAGFNEPGGLVGWNDGSITSCFSTGSVSGKDAGGLVGWNGGPITSCYSTGSVEGTIKTGGLVGYNCSSITSCYSTSPVSDTEGVGGLVGSDDGGIVTFSYWNVEASGQSTSKGGEGKTTYEMKQQSTFEGWNFNNTWQIQEGATYPYLRNNPQSPPPQ